MTNFRAASMLFSSTSIPIIFTLPVAANSRKKGSSWRQGRHQEPQTLIIAGPLIASTIILEFPSKHSRVVPEVFIALVVIVEHETTWPLPTLFGDSVPQDVSSSAQTNRAEMAFIESLHPSLKAPLP
jgi:hypothetical protein